MKGGRGVSKVLAAYLASFSLPAVPKNATKKSPKIYILLVFK